MQLLRASCEMPALSLVDCSGDAGTRSPYGRQGRSGKGEGMESLNPTSWTLFATVALFLVALLAPVPARADDVSIAASADPVEDVTYQITVSGTTSATTHVFATFKA